ncbi:MAG: hypothetical protein WBM00_04745 [Solirubrobacterales bacterium]
MVGDAETAPPSEAALDFMREHLAEEHGRDFDPERDLYYAGNAPAGAILTHRAETPGSVEGFWCSLCPGKVFMAGLQPELTEERIAHLARLDPQLGERLGEVGEAERAELVEAHEEEKNAAALLRDHRRRARLRQRTVQPEAQRRREDAQRYLLAKYEEIGNVEDALWSLLQLRNRDQKSYREVMGTDEEYKLETIRKYWQDIDLERRKEAKQRFLARRKAG